MEIDYQVVIPAAPKDFNKLNYVYQSLVKYLNPKPSSIIVVAPGITDGDLDYQRQLYGVMDEQKVLPGLDPMAAKNFNRPPWIFQQFIKLFQDITRTDYYLVVDSDLILNRPINLLTDEGKLKFFLGVDQNHEPYFRCSKDTFGFGREYQHSFISEIMMFYKPICNMLLNDFLAIHHQRQLFGDRSKNIKLLYDFITERACDDWIPADYELYGNYVEHRFGPLYDKVHIKTNLRGKLGVMWSDEEIEKYIEEMKQSDHDMFTLHTWL